MVSTRNKIKNEYLQQLGHVVFKSNIYAEFWSIVPTRIPKYFRQYLARLHWSPLAGTLHCWPATETFFSLNNKGIRRGMLKALSVVSMSVKAYV